MVIVACDDCSDLLQNNKEICACVRPQHVGTSAKQGRCGHAHAYILNVPDGKLEKLLRSVFIDSR